MKRVAFILFITLNILSAILASNDEAERDQVNKLEVKVFYEALCPYCVRFIGNQLYDAMITKNLLEYTDLKFIPYGNVKKTINPKTKRASLHCQHGHRECVENAFQACVVEHYTQLQQIKMIKCLLQKRNHMNCSNDLDINLDQATKCFKERHYVDILKPYGEQTNAIHINSVPSVAIGGSFNRSLQWRIVRQFSNVFCEIYKDKYGVTPPPCHQ